jgi:uncharacterized protein YjbI with pentapeptide repeats
VIGAFCGAVTLIFFMALIGLSTVGFTVPDDSKYLIVIILSFGLTLSGAFIGGAASLSGALPLPLAQAHPLKFAITGGAATFLISTSLGYWFYVPRHVPSINELMATVEDNKKPAMARQHSVNRLLNDLRVTDWHGRNLSGLELNATGWDNINLEEANLNEVNWEHAGLRGASLVRANLDGADLRFADFRGGALNGAVMRHAKCNSAYFQEVWLRAGTYIGTDFSGANLDHANLQWADFTDARFDGANLEDADFNDTSPSDLTRASFRRADIRGADFRGTVGMNLASFEGAVYDDRTQFPPYFRLVGRGMHKED